MSRTRTRRRPDASSDSGETASRPGSLSDAVNRDEARAKSRKGKAGMPFRFWQKRGEECEVIILDENIEPPADDPTNGAFWRQEHNLKGPDGKWGNHEPCIQETGPCPFCEEGSNPALVIFLSVLVLRPYKSKKTKEVKEYSKMLLAIKRGQLDDFTKIEKIAKKKHGTLRGASIFLYRKDEDNSFSTGLPVANDDGQLLNDWLSEDDLIEEFGHEAVEGRESGTILKKENEDIEPFDYRKLFPEPDADEIREAHGVEVAGSRKSSRRARQSDDDDDEIPMDHGEDDSPRRSRRSRRSRSSESESDTDESAEAEEKPAKSSRRRGRRSSKSDEPNFEK